MRKGKARRHIPRPFFKWRRHSTESERVLQIVADMAAAHKTIPESDPVEAMKNHTILIAGCKEACSRYHIPWRLVDIRTLHTGETRVDAALMLCRKVMTDGRLPMHKQCWGSGCNECKRTGLDALWRIK